jgi:lysyl-tRNA synthetase class 2
MKPEAKAAKTVELNEDEKAVLKMLKTAGKIELGGLKTQSGLSNKKWKWNIKNTSKSHH